MLLKQRAVPAAKDVRIFDIKLLRQLSTAKSYSDRMVICSMKSTSFFVDSIHEGIAVLLVGDGAEISLDVPLSILPAGVREGDYLNVSIEIDGDKRESMRSEIDSLMEELGDNP